MLPTISVVTPTLNQGKFIEQTIESVLSQGYPNLEYLVMDGGSTDGTLKILEKYTGLLKWISEPDKGQVDALNKGIRRVSGEVVAYLNSDDVYLPGTLQKVGDFFQNNPDTMIVTGKCRNIDSEGNPTRSFVTLYKNFLLRKNDFDLLKMTNYISQPSTFWKRALHDEIGYFNPEYRYAMDYDLWLHIAQNHRIYFLDDDLASFRIYPTSITSSNSKKQFQEQYRVASCYANTVYKVIHKIHAWVSYAIYLLINR